MQRWVRLDTIHLAWRSVMSLYVEPVCLLAQEECEVVVFSIKAAQVYAKERSRPSTPVSILLVKNDTIVLHAVCTAVGEHALFR